MKIYDLNNDIILNILIFLDLNTIYLLKTISKKFYIYFKLAFEKISYVGILIHKGREIKRSYVVNPSYYTFNILLNFKDSKKLFINYYGKKDIVKIPFH